MNTSEPSGPRHWLEDHTAEVRLAVLAPTLESLFVEAGRAIAELAVGEAPLPPPEGDPVSISIDSVDLDALLVDWLNELVYHTEVDQKAYVELVIDAISPTRLDARVRGAAFPDLRPLVKAATLHDVHVTEDSNGFSVRVVLDI